MVRLLVLGLGGGVVAAGLVSELVVAGSHAGLVAEPLVDGEGFTVTGLSGGVIAAMPRIGWW